MPLAAILGLCVLLGYPASDGLIARQAAIILQSTQPQQDSPQTKPQQEPAKPEPEAKPEQKPKAEEKPNPEQETKPGQETKPDQPSTPPPATAPQQPESPQPESTPKQTECNTPAFTGGESKGEKGKTSQPGDGPTKVVVRHGSTADPKIQLSPSLTQKQAAQQRQNIDQLVANTNANLKSIVGRQLSPNQQEMVNQIRKYLEQAKSATDTGDLLRAHNLAFKARLLSEELLRR
jgi:hypothetical protein